MFRIPSGAPFYVVLKFFTQMENCSFNMRGFCSNLDVIFSYLVFINRVVMNTLVLNLISFNELLSLSNSLDTMGRNYLILRQ